MLGVIAGKMPKPDIDAAYHGLAGKSVGVMVWVDPSTLIDWPGLPLDLANSLDAKLKEAQAAKQKELEGTTFPYQPRSFVRYQKEHPGINALPIIDVAPKLDVARLVYVEVNSFSSRADGAVAMYLGQMDASIKVIEVENGVAKLGYSESGIRIQYPRSAPREGQLNQTDRAMYAGSINEMSTELAIIFFRHPDLSP
ncbi:MAG: hypothetical protein H7144_04795 [Burkholderiales bacterium]|nr:hypothetical protein [Phycisphaerae bacterium]